MLSLYNIDNNHLTLWSISSCGEPIVSKTIYHIFLLLYNLTHNNITYVCNNNNNNI